MVFSFRPLWTIFIIALSICCCLPLRADDFTTVRLRRFELLAGPPQYNINDPAVLAQISLLNTNAERFWSTMNKATHREYLWNDLAGTAASSHITSAYARLRWMALAYATRGTALTGNAEILGDLMRALGWMYANRYNPHVVRYDNWWDWQIGTPEELEDIMVLLYLKLSPEQRVNYLSAIDHFVPEPFGTGANLMWTCEVVALQGVIGEDTGKVASATSALAPFFAYVTSGSGFYRDGSFIQHANESGGGGFPYNGGYGVAAITGIFDYLYMYSGTRWAVPSSESRNAFQWLNIAFAPFLYRGEMMDAVRGREISRSQSTSHVIGREVVGAFIRATQVAPSAEASAYRVEVKHWIQVDTTFSNPYAGLSLYNVLQAEAIMRNRSVKPRAQPATFHIFPQMDRVVQRRPRWAAALSMFSTRRYNYEAINNENLHGWHTADGMLYVYTADEEQFSDNFWPTVDSYRLPGTTIEAGTTEPEGALSQSPFAGGAPDWGSRFGAVGMQLSPPKQTLRAKKAWFFLDDAIVCLGAGITAADGREVETIVDNRRLSASGANAFDVNGSIKTGVPAPQPAKVSLLENVKYAHLSGNVRGADIGYYFPNSSTLNMVRETRSGSWNDINKYSGAPRGTIHTNNYLTLWINHGKNPSDGDYAYALLPTMSANEVRAYARHPEFQVLENSSRAQAIQDSKLGLVAALFWQSKAQKIGSGLRSISSSGPSAVIAVTKGTLLQVTVSDPTQKNTGSIEVKLGFSAVSTINHDPGIVVTQMAPDIQFRAKTEGLKGQSLRVEFKLVSGH